MVTHRQLLSLGLSGSAVGKRAQSGRLHRLHRGVYAVGYAGPSETARWMAAVLACGVGAVLSHGSATALWGLLQPQEGAVDVSTPSRAGRRRRPGIRLHRCRSLARRGEGERRLVTRRHGIPVTTPERTLHDIAGSLPDHLVRRATREADRLGLLKGSGIETDGTRSDLEAAFLRICRRHRLPPPEVNVAIGRHTVDFLWRAERLVVETDGYRYHRGRAAFEGDRDRDLVLHGAGFTVLRLAERHVVAEADRVAGLLAGELRANRSG